MLTERVNHVWSRARVMDRRELIDRGRQEFGKRADAVRHRLHHDFARPEMGGLANRRAKFFFDRDDVPSRVALVQQRCAEDARDTVRRAERICQHRFDLLGFEDLDYGAVIDWHLDLVHDKRGPRKPFYKVRYLDFAEVGDCKITWELNRHQHFVTLAKAFHMTGDAKFATEILRQWEHWHAENPFPIGMNWASSLEVSFRSLSWLWSFLLLEDAPVLPAGFRGQWLRSLAINARHIERNLSTYFSPNTHLLGEGVALFFIGTLCPELRSAPRWQEQGWKIVLGALEDQVRADGFYFEQSVYYHVYALDFFLHAAVLASVNDIDVPPSFDRTLENMLDVLCVLGRAGAPPRLGDDDGGRVFDPRRNRAEHMLDPLSTGAVLCRRGDFKFVSGGLREETIWLLGARGVAEYDRLLAEPPSASSVALPAGGLYVLSGDQRQQLVIDAGPQGGLSAGHGHADALSVCVNGEGRALLIDPGTCEYVGEGSQRDVFRGTRAHNTLVVDDRDQAERRGPFGWKQLPTARTEEWISGETFDLFVGSHDGYCRLEDPVVHRRWVFSSRSRFWLVRDLAVGTGRHQLDLYWHLHPALAPRTTTMDTFLDPTGDYGLRLLAPEASGWTCDTRQASYSPTYGAKESSVLRHFGTVATLPTELATLFVTIGDAASAAQGRLLRINELDTQPGMSGYRYETPDEQHFVYFSDDGSAWCSGAWKTDAKFLYYGEGSGGQTLVCCHASYVQVGGRKLLSSTKPVLRCEIVDTGDGVRVTSSDEAASVDETLFRSLSARPESVSARSFDRPARTEP